MILYVTQPQSVEQRICEASKACMKRRERWDLIGWNMGSQSAAEVVFITVSQNITLVGKLWLLVMIFLRIFLLIFAGYPLYQDEQERFVCNTIQPGCANVCYDLFAPLSLLRFWLLQLTVLCLPYITFVTYVIHKVLSDIAGLPDASGQIKARSRIEIQQTSPGKKALGKARHIQTDLGSLRDVTCAYIIQLLFRIVLEAGFGVTQYYLFGFSIPKRFLCHQSPCTTIVDCYVSRPTEKTVMLNFLLGTAALSFLLNILDMICAIKRSVRHKTRRKMLVQNLYEEEQYFYAPAGGSQDVIHGNEAVDDDLVTSVTTATFRKRGLSKCSGKDFGSIPNLEEATCGRGTPLTPQILDSENAAKTDSRETGSFPIPTQDESPERQGSELALCPPELLGTPRAIRVSKRGRLKPPPPPRRDKAPAAPGSVDVVTASSAVCTRRIGHYSLVEMRGPDTTDNQETKSEWV